jgi:hypothetical protein
MFLSAKGGGRRERGERRAEKKYFRVNVCWCILILRCTSKRHTSAKFCWCAPENYLLLNGLNT